jgi:hypothetical protein
MLSVKAKEAILKNTVVVLTVKLTSDEITFLALAH